jgi:DNA-binding SARP family transcriptional activator
VGDLVARCRACNDQWGEALLRLLEVLHELGRGRGSRAGARHTTELLEALPAPALAAWARAAEALAGGKGTADRAELRRLVRDAARVGPLPQAMALLALARADGLLGTTALPDPVAALARQCDATLWLKALTRSPSTPAPRTPMHPSLDASAGTTPQESEQGSSGRLQVCVLGSFALVRAGEPVSLQGLRPLHRELLRLFCAHTEQPVRREQLIEWFWSDAEPQRAHHSLQVALSVVRRQIQPLLRGSVRAGLVRDGAHYRLQLAHPDDCDARRMESHVALAETAARHGDRLAAIDLLGTAVSAYRGELLPEDACAEWAQVERERLRAVASTAFERLVSLRAELGQHAAAADSARAGLAHDPTRDALWRHLVAALKALDQPVAAAAAQRSYDAMRADLGVGPAGS